MCLTSRLSASSPYRKRSRSASLLSNNNNRLPSGFATPTCEQHQVQENDLVRLNEKNPRILLRTAASCSMGNEMSSLSYSLRLDINAGASEDKSILTDARGSRSPLSFLFLFLFINQCIYIPRGVTPVAAENTEECSPVYYVAS